MELTFNVNGTIRSMFTTVAGVVQPKFIGNMQVELWHKGPLEVVFLGSGTTAADGHFNITFKRDSASPIVESGQIKEVFIKVYYNNKLVVGDKDPSAGSFD